MDLYEATKHAAALAGVTEEEMAQYVRQLQAEGRNEETILAILDSYDPTGLEVIEDWDAFMREICAEASAEEDDGILPQL